MLDCKEHVLKWYTGESWMKAILDDHERILDKGHRTSFQGAWTDLELPTQTRLMVFLKARLVSGESTTEVFGVDEAPPLCPRFGQRSPDMKVFFLLENCLILKNNFEIIYNVNTLLEKQLYGPLNRNQSLKKHVRKKVYYASW